MILRQDKDFIQKYQRVLSEQSSSASPAHEFSFTECRDSPWYQLQFLIHYGSAVIGVGATPSMAAFPTSRSAPSFSAPSTQDSGQGSGFHALQTSIPQLEVSLQGTNDISSAEVSQSSFRRQRASHLMSPST